MTDIERLQAAFEAAERAQKVRDESIRQSFMILTDAIKRLTATVELVSATVAGNSEGLERAIGMIEAMPDAIAAAVDEVIDASNDTEQQH